MPSHAQRQVFVIVNPARVQNPSHLRTVIDAELAARGHPSAHYLSTTVADPGAGQARTALDDGAGLILVAGGDGTLRMVLGAVRGSGVPVGVLPVGTGNLLARNLRLPLRLEPAVRQALDGTPRPLDLIHHHNSEGEGFAVVMAGMGADAAVVADTNPRLKRLGSLGYVLAGRRHVRARPTPTRVTVDGQTLVRAASLVEVGNLGELRQGVQLFPDADSSDGVLNVLVAAPRHSGDVVRMMAGVLARSSRIPYVDRISGRNILVECEEAVPCQVDGDYLGAVKSMRFDVLPAAVLVSSGR